MKRLWPILPHSRKCDIILTGVEQNLGTFHTHYSHFKTSKSALIHIYFPDVSELSKIGRSIYIADRVDKVYVEIKLFKNAIFLS